MLRRTAAPVLLAAAVLGCSAGTSCDELPALTRERDAARLLSTRVVQAHEQGQSTQAEVDRVHDEEHALDARVFDLSQKCD